MKLTRLLTLFFAFALVFNISCSNDDTEITAITYENGYFISNEGKFNDKNASVTFVSRDLSLKQDNIFGYNNNDAILGDVLQMIAFNGNNAYLVVNNSNKIVVVNRSNFTKVAEITDHINQPRSMTFANGNIYVSNNDYGTNKYVSIYKASDLSYVTKIDFTEYVETILTAGQNVFVQNASGGFGNKFTYINTSNNSKTEFTVPNGNLNKMVSYNSEIYAIAGGTTDSYIYKIGTTGVTETKVLTGIANATNLQIENNKYFFSSANKVYSMNMNATTTPTTPLFTAVDGGPYLTLYGFTVVDGKIFTSDIKGFTEDSEITVYSATSGAEISKFKAGKGSNGTFLNQ